MRKANRSTFKPSNQDLCYRLPKGPCKPEKLIANMKEEGQIRFYYIKTVEWCSSRGKANLYQYGNGLNLESKMATLCTCKRDMLKSIEKHWRNSKKKEPLYIGVLGSTKGRNPKLNYKNAAPLVFLGEVKNVYRCFHTAWKKIPKQVKILKNVKKVPLGDLYPVDLLNKYATQSRLDPSDFAMGYVHANKIYEEDIKNSCPITFEKWCAWPEANCILKPKKGSDEFIKKFNTMIRKPRQCRYGWKYSTEEILPILRSSMRRKNENYI